jgi:hypothetical protein
MATRYFSLWTDDANASFRERVFDKMSSKLSFVEMELLVSTYYTCGECNKERNVTYLMLTVVCNPMRYISEGEIIVCEKCIRVLERNLPLSTRYLRVTRWEGNYLGEVELVSSRFICVFSNHPYVFNLQRNYYVNIQDVLYKNSSFMSDIEIRALHPLTCNPYFLADSTLHNILLHKLTI